MISLNKTGSVMVLKIQMFFGLIGKRNFWILLTFMHHSDLDALETIKHPGSIHNLKKGMRDRDAAKRKAITSNDSRDWEKYKKLRNKINNNIKNSKVSYYSIAFIQSKGNPRKTWQTRLYELTSRRVNNTTVKELKLNDAVIANPSELSNSFNDHFSTIGLKRTNEIPPIANNNSSYINNINVNNMQSTYFSHFRYS